MRQIRSLLSGGDINSKIRSPRQDNEFLIMWHPSLKHLTKQASRTDGFREACLDEYWLNRHIAAVKCADSDRYAWRE
ncbi:MAG: hypothetical protein F6K28_45170 [Microcoleus sp. SIO2G3]|nr:hypothetical protein [Microcoleus sp. SIO2G3]